MRKSLAVLALVLSAAPAVAQEPVDATVQVPRSTYLLDLPFLHFASMTGPAPAPGALAVSLASSYSNTFSHSWHPYAIHLEYGLLGQPFRRDEAEELHVRHGEDTIFFVDAEVLRTVATIELGLTDESSVSVEIPHVDFAEASLDNGILAFHRAFGLSQAQRTDFPTRQFVLMLQSPGGPLTYDDRRPSSGLGDVVVTSRWRHPLSAATLLSADVALKLPTGAREEFRGSGSFDAGALLGLTTTKGRQSYTLQLGFVVPGRWKGPVGYDASPFGHLVLGTSRSLGRRRQWGASFAVLVEGSPLAGESLRAVSHPAVEVVLGITRAVGAFGRLELAVNEHIPRFGDGTDVGVRLGLALAPFPLR